MRCSTIITVLCICICIFEKKRSYPLQKLRFLSVVGYNFPLSLRQELHPVTYHTAYVHYSKPAGHNVLIRVCWVVIPLPTFCAANVVVLVLLSALLHSVSSSFFRKLQVCYKWMLHVWTPVKHWLKMLFSWFLSARQGQIYTLSSHLLLSIDINKRAK